MDFLRREAEFLDLMNIFLSLFRESDVLYVCNTVKGTTIPSFFTGKYEITKIVPAKYGIRRYLFKKPELIVTQPPELWARCLEMSTQSRSSVNNYMRTKSTAPDQAPLNRINFDLGRALVINGKLSVSRSMRLEVFNSSLAYSVDPDRVEKFETLAEFEQKYYKDKDTPSARYCIARISSLPVLCFPA